MSWYYVYILAAILRIRQRYFEELMDQIEDAYENKFGRHRPSKYSSLRTEECDEYLLIDDHFRELTKRIKDIEEGALCERVFVSGYDPTRLMSELISDFIMHDRLFVLRFSAQSFWPKTWFDLNDFPSIEEHTTLVENVQTFLNKEQRAILIISNV